MKEGVSAFTFRALTPLTRVTLQHLQEDLTRRRRRRRGVDTCTQPAIHRVH